MKRLIILFALLASFTYTLFAAEVTKRGTTAASFLQMGVGARALGMGGAFVAISDDIHALYWNPAGLVYVSGGQFLFDHMNYFVDISFNYVGVAYSMQNNGVIGVALTAMDYGEMERTTEDFPEGTGERFSASEYAAQLSYARNITDRFSFGFSAKYLYQGIWHSSAKGFAIDVGTLYRTGFRGLTLGMSISNFGTKMQMSGKDLLVQVDIAPDLSGNNETINAYLSTDRFDLPLLFRVGIGMDVFQNEKNTLKIAVDALHPNDNKESLNLGFEYNYRSLVYLRGGYENLFLDKSPRQYSVGFGLAPKLFGNKSIRIDYVFQKWKYLNDIQKFSLTAEF